MVKFTKFTLLTFLLLYDFLSAQSQSRTGKIALSFVAAYNQQNYSGMSRSFMALAKIFPLKKVLKQEFEPRFKNLGKANILSVNQSSPNKIVLEISYEKDVTEKDVLVFLFNNKSKISGLYFESPDYLYPKGSYNSIHTDKIAAIDSVLKIKSSLGFNGCATVMDNGKEIYKKSFGLSNLTTKEQLNTNSIFELASCSKQFTGMAVMILAEQGKLKYSDTIQKYIQELPYPNITIQNLLSHTSGLPDYMTLLEKHWDKSKYATNYDIVNLLAKYKPKTYFKPNEKFDYSNTGYALLSVIIERTSGLSYRDFLDKYIFQKLDMRNSRVYNTRRSKGEKINNYAYGYVFSSKLNRYILPDSLTEFKEVIYLDAITGDGSVNSSVSDLALWENALRENKLVLNTTFDQIYSSNKLKNGKEINYNFGQFILTNDKNEKLIYHGGDWPGYKSFILHFVDKPLSIILLSNNEYNVAKLADQIALILLRE